MDNKNLLAVLEDGESRLAEALRSTDVKDKDYGLMVETLAHVRGLAEAIARREGRTPYAPIAYNLDTHEVIMPEPEGQPAGASFVEEKEPKMAKKSKSAPVESAAEETKEQLVPAAEAHAEETPAESAITPAPKPEHTLTKLEVRSALASYANEGVDVAAIMLSMGYSKLSDIPDSKYAELLEAVKKAVG